jgi:predicted ABC-type ATPase
LTNLNTNAKRLRIFAGPNGSGKSTIIQSVRQFKKSNGTPIDFGVYINADDIALQLRNHSFSYDYYGVEPNLTDFLLFAEKSGLLIQGLNSSVLKKVLDFSNPKKIILKDLVYNERIAQLFAAYFRDRLLCLGRKMTFETVFSHPSKLDFMREAISQGYRVYLYFVATEDPSINVYRVKEVRVKEHGHDVPEDKIRSRYHRCLDLLFEASQLAYRCYYFDNSAEGTEFSLFANFKLNKDKNKVWDLKEVSKVPDWFRIYYSAKVALKKSTTNSR